MNIFAGTPALKTVLEAYKANGELPHVKAIRSAHPGKDIEQGRTKLTDSVLYVYPSGSRIKGVAGKGKLVDLDAGIALTYCVSMKSANDEDSLRRVGETVWQLISSLSGLKLPPVIDGNTKTILGAFEIDPETRELHHDGFYFFSIRVLTDSKIHNQEKLL